MVEKTAKKADNKVEKKLTKLLQKDVTTNILGLPCRINKATFEALEKLKSIDKEACAELISDALESYDIPALVEAYLEVRGKNG